MPIPIVFNGLTYYIPVTRDQNWGPNLTRYLVALGTYPLTPAGGAFTLTADANFGATYGLISKYFTSHTVSPAIAGSLRLAKTDTIDWLNNAGSGDNILSTDSSDNLVWNGVVVPTGLATLADGKIWIGSAGGLPVAQTLTGDVTVSDTGLTAIGALKIIDAQISNSAAITYSKLNLSGSIINSDIYSSAAIDYSKLATLTADKVLISNGSGIVSASTITSITLGYLDATSSIQTQLNGKQPTLSIGNLTDTGTDGITVTGGTGAVIGSGTSLSQHVADTTHAGYLSSTDWNTFNGKQPAFSGLTTNGVIYATSTTAEASTAAGTTGQFLAANTGAAPTWGTPSGSGTVNSGTAPDLAYYKTSTNAVSPVDADASMASNKITNLKNGTSAQDAATWSQLKIDLLGTATASNSASISFTGLQGASYSEFFVVMVDIVPAASAVLLYCQISTGSGILVANYSDMQNRIVQSGANGYWGDSGAPAWTLGPQTEMMGTPHPLSGKIEFFGADSVKNQKRQTYTSESVSSNGAVIAYVMGGGQVDTQSAVIDGIKFLMTSGNITSGTFYLYGIRNS